MIKKYFAVLLVLVIAPLFAEKSQVKERKIEPLPEICIGQKNAPVTVIQYTSFTCTHCGEFHRTVMPVIEEKYVKSGKVRVIMRDYPSDKISLEAARIAWCCGALRYKEIAAKLFELQDEWLMAPDPSSALHATAKKIGVTEEQIKASLEDKELMEKLVLSRQDGKKKYNIEATPTIIINTTVVPYAMTVEEFEQIVDPLLKTAASN